MRNKLILLLAVIVTVALTACAPVKKQPDQHEMWMLVEVTENNHSIKLPIHLWADVTIKTGEHGINRENGKPYPSTWETNKGSGSSTIDYWSRSNPTTFAIRGTIYLRDLLGQSDAAKFRLKCSMFKDGILISPLQISGNISALISGKTAKAKLLAQQQFFIVANCKYVDRG